MRFFPIPSARPFLVHSALFACGGIAIASAHADTLVDNVQGIRFERDGSVERFGAMLIDDDGRVRQLYRHGEKRPKDVDYRVNGEGRTLLPGFVDAHVRLVDLGFSTQMLDLSQATGLADAQRRIAAFAARYPNRPWIIGTGWNPALWDMTRPVTATDIDAAVADRPVWLLSRDGQTGWANSRTMNLLGITAATADPVGGRVERLSGSKKPSGVFTGGAMALVADRAPAPRPAERDLALEKAQSLLLSHGITAVSDMGTTMDDWQTYRRAGDWGRLQIRIISYAASVEDMVAIAGPAPTPWLYDDRLRLNGVALTIDGDLASRTALLAQPYADAPGTSGLRVTDGTRLRNMMSRAAMDGFQVALNASGDAAVDEALTAIAEIRDTFGGDRRWRVEGGELMEPASATRLHSTDVVASVRPWRPADGFAMLERRVGPVRSNDVLPWRSVTSAGAPLAFGSGAPGTDIDPWHGIAIAVTRQDRPGEPFAGWQPEQRIGVETALAAYTAASAWAGQAEGRFGSLKPGERADFILVSTDPLMASPQDLRGMQVLETWIDGKRVYRRETASAQR